MKPCCNKMLLIGAGVLAIAAYMWYQKKKKDKTAGAVISLGTSTGKTTADSSQATKDKLAAGGKQFNPLAV